MAAFRRRALGRTIECVDRAGKRVVVRLDSGDAIVIEPRMTGLVLLADPPNREHLRLRIVVADSASIAGKRRTRNAAARFTNCCIGIGAGWARCGWLRRANSSAAMAPRSSGPTPWS